MTRDEARAELVILSALLVEYPDDGDILASWLIANYWANLPEAATA